MNLQHMRQHLDLTIVHLDTIYERQRLVNSTTDVLDHCTWKSRHDTHLYLRLTPASIRAASVVWAIRSSGHRLMSLYLSPSLYTFVNEFSLEALGTTLKVEDGETRQDVFVTLPPSWIWLHFEFSRNLRNRTQKAFLNSPNDQFFMGRMILWCSIRSVVVPLLQPKCCR